MKAKKVLLSLIILIILFVLTFIIQPSEDSFSICPTKAFLGVRCPFCGLGRALSYFSQCQFKRAFSTYKAVFIFYPLYVLCMYLLLIYILNINGIIKMPGLRFLYFLKTNILKVIYTIIAIALVFYIYDLFSGDGEAFFSFKYTVFSLFKR